MKIFSNIEKINIHEQGIIATLFFPKNIKNAPGVIVVPGSDGAVPESISELIASNGYVVLALKYFGADNLPEKLSNISLEYFYNAIQYFKKKSQVNKNKVALLGYSRGGELVLLFSAMYPQEISAVIAYTPPHLVYGDFSPNENAAWSFKGLPIPFMPNLSYEDILKATKDGHLPFHKGTLDDPFEATPNFLYAMKMFYKNIDSASIPVEKILCPILILTGEDDKIWPATISGNLIIKRLDDNGSNTIRKHLSFSNAGHELYLSPHQPSTDQPFQFGTSYMLLGGTSEGNASAKKESWQEVFNFLKNFLA